MTLREKIAEYHKLQKEITSRFSKIINSLDSKKTTTKKSICRIVGEQYLMQNMDIEYNNLMTIDYITTPTKKRPNLVEFTYYDETYDTVVDVTLPETCLVETDMNKVMAAFTEYATEVSLDQIFRSTPMGN